MKDIREVLHNKEQEIQRLEREIEILRAAVTILDGGDGLAVASPRTVTSARGPASVETITGNEVQDRPKRAFP